MSLNIVCLLPWMGLILSVTETPTPAPPEPSGTYGKATVSEVLRIDPACTLYCNLQGLPPVIGEDMPVRINGLKTADAIEYNRKIQAFLNDLLLKKTEKRPAVHLKNIRRGDTFCFLADVEIDGKDLCDLLVQNGLAQRIIEIKEPVAPQASASAPSAALPRISQQAYMASKTSKIFHRSDCSHAKRIDAARAVYFTNRQQAVQTGRQPCKTCNP